MNDLFDNIEISTKPSEVMVNPVVSKNNWDFAIYCELIYNKNEYPIEDKDYVINTINKVVTTRLRMLNSNSDIEYSISVYFSDKSMTDKPRTNGETNEVICVETDFTGVFSSVKAVINFMKCLNSFDACDFSDKLTNISYGIRKLDRDEYVSFDHRFYINRHQFKITNSFFEIYSSESFSFFAFPSWEDIAEFCNYLWAHKSLSFETTDNDKTCVVTANRIKSIINFFDANDDLAVSNNLLTLVARSGIYPPSIKWYMFANPSSFEFDYIEKYNFDFRDTIMRKSLCGLEEIIENPDISVSVSTIESQSVNKYDPGKDVKTDKLAIKNWVDELKPLCKKRWIKAFYRIGTDKNVMMAGFNCGHSYDSVTDKYYINTIAICGETEKTIKAIKKIFV